MLLVADVHGAADALRAVAAEGEPLVVLGDLINFIDYRNNQGIVTQVTDQGFVDELVRLRTAGEFNNARTLWRQYSDGREEELRRRFDMQMSAEYRVVCAALEGVESYVTYGNVDRPDMLASLLPDTARFVDGEVVSISGHRVGIVGGGMITINTPGEITEDAMADKLDALGPVDVLCTHVPPAIEALSSDVIGGRQKGSSAISDYLHDVRPSFHYFGDIHQPQASQWRVGNTVCRNVGYFRATGRAVRHG